jgi:hypothetical protein
MRSVTYFLEEEQNWQTGFVILRHQIARVIMDRHSIGITKSRHTLDGIPLLMTDPGISEPVRSSATCDHRK